MTAELTDPVERHDVFGSVHLGYVVVETQKFTEWKRLGKEAIGLHHEDMSADLARWRIDDHAVRYLFQRGPREDVTAFGWEIDDHETFDTILARVADRGVPIEEGSEQECALRGVERLWRFPGPRGIATELYTVPVLTPEPLVMMNKEFVTGTGGMGHVAIISKDQLAIQRYYNTVFDARLTDYCNERIGPMILKVRFLRVNDRHHSVAVGGVNSKINPIRNAVHHLNLQVAELGDMVTSYERVVEMGYRITHSVGQHSNDRELSYYAATPSGFEIEVGWNPVTITPEREATWEPATYQTFQTWGHTMLGDTVAQKFELMKQAFLSRKQEEPDLVPALSSEPELV